MEWRNVQVLEFIYNYEMESILWNNKHPSYKRKQWIYDAWLRIKNNLSWKTTIEEMKRKRDSLMACYRTIINKMRKSISSGQELYQTTWFAFEAMDKFLGPIYDCHLNQPPPDEDPEERNGDNQEREDINIETKIEIEEHAEHRKQFIENSFVELVDCRKIQEKTLEEVKLRGETPSVSKSDVAFSNKRNMCELASNKRKRISKDIDSNAHSDDEYDMFAKFIALKIRKLKNPNMRDVVMNDVHNLVVRACLSDRQGNRLNSQYPESFSQASQSAFYQFLSSSHANGINNNKKCTINCQFNAQNESSSNAQADLGSELDDETCFEEVLLDS